MCLSIAKPWSELRKRLSIGESELELTTKRMITIAMDSTFQKRYRSGSASAIGYIIKADGSQIPLYYGEIKIVKATGEYHAIPRTSPRRTS